MLIENAWLFNFLKPNTTRKKSILTSRNLVIIFSLLSLIHMTRLDCCLLPFFGFQSKKIGLVFCLLVESNYMLIYIIWYEFREITWWQNTLQWWVSRIQSTSYISSRTWKHKLVKSAKEIGLKEGCITGFIVTNACFRYTFNTKSLNKTLTSICHAQRSATQDTFAN